MAPHSSTLAWKIPWTEEPGRLQSMGSPRVGHDWAASLSLSTFMHWRRKWQPTPVFLPGEFQGLGSRWAAVYGVAQGRTWLKRLSSSSRICSIVHHVVGKTDIMYQERQIWVVLMECQLHVMMEDNFFFFSPPGSHPLNAVWSAPPPTFFQERQPLV